MTAKFRCTIYVFAAALLSMTANSAFAADFLAKTPAGAAASNWSGLYLGVHAGYGWSSTPSVAQPLPDPISYGLFPTPVDIDGHNAIGGFQAGYNWQFSPNWVAGMEADFSWAGINASASARMSPVPPAPCTLKCDVFMNAGLDYLGTVRARLGYVWNNNLFYATGGFAYGRLAFDGNATTGNIVTIHQPASVPSSMRTGWTVGAGVEQLLFGGAWTVKGEYLFYNLAGASVVGFEVPDGPPFGQRYVWDDTQIHVFRVGLNYRFGN